MKRVILGVLILCGVWRCQGQAIPAATIQSRADAAITMTLYGASEFDAATTYASIHKCSACREGDPLLEPFAGNPSIFLMLGLQAWAVDRARRSADSSGHPRLGRLLECGVIAVHIFAGAHNLAALK